MHRLPRLLLLALAVALAAVRPAPAFELTVLHVGDSHSYLDPVQNKLRPGGMPVYVRLGGWARLGAAVSAVRARGGNVLLLHAGDAVQGGLYFLTYGGRPEMELLDLLGFDALVPGNHEFDQGAETLAAMLAHTEVPVLAANLDASGVPALAGRMAPYAIVPFGDERVGVVGLCTSRTPEISNPGPGVAFADEIEAARAAVRELEDRGVDKIILLTHVGLARDLELAAAVEGADAVVGGHSHSLLGDSRALRALGLSPDGPYPVAVRGARGKNVPVASAWKWTQILGRLDLSFDEAGRVTGWSGAPRLLLADSVRRKDVSGAKVELAGAERAALLAALERNPMATVLGEDQAVLDHLAPYAQGLRAIRVQVAGRAGADLPHIQVPGVSESGTVLPGGSLVAPEVCRAMLHKLRSTGEGADLFLQNAGGVRTGLEAGDVTVGDVLAMLPFGNTLFVLRATGAQVKAALEHGIDRGKGAFPYLGGARYEANMSLPAGLRVTSVEVRSGARWRPLDPARTYRLATNAFLAGGGDGYAVLKDVGDRLDTGFMEAEAFIEYLRAQRIIRPTGDTGVVYHPPR